MEELKQGRVWEQHGNIYGHINQWEVISVHPKFAMVRNMATLNQVVCDVDSESSFTFDNKLTDVKGWG